MEIEIHFTNNNKKSLWNVSESVYKGKQMGYNEIVKKLTKDKFLESYGGKYGW